MPKLPLREDTLAAVGNKSSLRLGYKTALKRPLRNTLRANKSEPSVKVALFLSSRN
jgi:hypothetical protein